MTGSGRRRNSLVALAVGAGGVLLLPGLGYAQAPPATGASSGLGAAGGGQKPFTVDVIGAILYDSNLGRGQDAINDARDLHKSDITYSPAVAVTVALPVGRNLLFLNGTAGYDFHQYNTELDSGRVNVAAGGLARLGACEANVAGAYAVQQSNLADLPIRVTRNRQTTRSVSTQLTCLVGSSLTGFLGVSASDASNSADANLVDSDSVSVNGGFGYGNRQLGTLQIIGGFTKTNYDENTTPLVMMQPGFEAYNVGLQYSRAIGNRLTGSASIGYQTVHSDSPLMDDSSNISGSGALDYQLNSRIGLNLAYSRSAAPTIIEGYDYILDESYSVGARYTLSSRIQSSFGASWTRTDYKGTAPLVLDVPSEERTRRLYGQVGLMVGRTASVSLNVSQEKRTSKPEVFNYTAYQVGVTAKKSF